VSTLRQSHDRHREPQDAHHDLPPRARDVGVIAWCSFLAAGAGTMVTFAFFDPASIPLDAVPMFWQSRPALYAIGFFLFWGMAAFSAALTLYMVRTSSAGSE
jgi:hypothetical protein